MDNLEEIDKFLEMYKLPKLKQEEIENLNRPITQSNWNSNQKSPNKQKSESDGFPGEFYWTFKELTPIPFNLSPKIEMEGKNSNSSMRQALLILNPDKNSTKTENYRPISLMNMDAKIFK